jgi:hypothetical protein
MHLFNNNLPNIKEWVIICSKQIASAENVADAELARPADGHRFTDWSQGVLFPFRILGCCIAHHQNTLQHCQKGANVDVVVSCSQQMTIAAEPDIEVKQSCSHWMR